MFLQGKILLLLYFIWNTHEHNQVIKSSVIFTIITAITYLFVCYLGNMQPMHVAIMAVYDFVAMSIFLWIIVQHSGIAYWVLVVLGSIIYFQGSFYLLQKFYTA
ncbi:MAG: hypothetical protein JXQ65_12355 [Candidatus Marinimicrobia bacterium]|nr:hypothetical protein [Candidatus Neomarinimicrobiota bacterium]